MYIINKLFHVNAEIAFESAILITIFSNNIIYFVSLTWRHIAQRTRGANCSKNRTREGREISVLVAICITTQCIDLLTFPVLK